MSSLSDVVAYGESSLANEVGQIILGAVSCSGMETSLLSCTHQNFLECNTFQIAGVVCRKYIASNIMSSLSHSQELTIPDKSILEVPRGSYLYNLEVRIPP